ncbi:MAG: Fe-S protein assembly co-chaperone HscB [Rubrivivax sp.]|nr:Fe-S protein assembly co-chaperone HscB [Rubrivivax sp.]
MKLDDDDFTLFGLPERHALDRADIDSRWRQLQAEVHPDRFAGEGAAAQRRAMQWAVRVNEAYQRLKDPLKRAAYLCERRGAAIQAENNTAMPAAFLMQQMQWREALEDAPDMAAVEGLDDEVASAERTMLADVARLLDVQGDAAAAAAQVRALMFVNRFRQDIERRLDALDPAHSR